MRTIGELLERNASFYPHKEALICGGRRLTWRELVDRARRLADGLQVAATRHDNVATDVLPLGQDGWLRCSYGGSLHSSSHKLQAALR